MIVAIDGPAGTGKSILAKMISEKMGFFLLNTGLFYRGLTYQWISEGHDDVLDSQKLSQIAESSTYEEHDGGFFIDGEEVLSHLRTSDIDRLVSQVSAFPDVREILNEKMRMIAQKKENLICEGRDTTTVVFPDAQIKIYLDASIHVRALRRFNEKCSDLSLQEIEELIAQRDHNDKTKPVGALRISKTAWYIDSSDLTLNEVYERVKGKIFDFLQ